MDRTVLSLSSAIVLLAANWAPLNADEAKPKSDAVRPPETYAAAVAATERLHAEFTKLLEKGELKTVHDRADELQSILGEMPKLAMKEDSGVAKKDVREINLAAKAILALLEDLDVAIHAEDAGEARKAMKDIAPSIETFRKFVPKDEKKP